MQTPHGPSALRPLTTRNQEELLVMKGVSAFSPGSHPTQGSYEGSLVKDPQEPNWVPFCHPCLVGHTPSKPL